MYSLRQVIKIHDKTLVIGEKAFLFLHMSGVWNKVLDADYEVNVLGANSIMKLWSLWTDFSKEIIVYLNTTYCLVALITATPV